LGCNTKATVRAKAKTTAKAKAKTTAKAKAKTTTKAKTNARTKTGILPHSTALRVRMTTFVSDTK
jgi:hypothetical protein